MLWNKVKEGIVAADYWKSYKKMVPTERLIQSKSETYTVESYNGVIRHFWARFRRKTKHYSNRMLWKKGAQLNYLHTGGIKNYIELGYTIRGLMWHAGVFAV